MITAFPDNPVSDWEVEHLGRRRLVKGLSEIITSCPSGGSLRIGVYGDWGSGKTSVMRLLRRELKEAGHACPWMTAWASESSQDTSRRLLFSILDELSIEYSRYRFWERGRGAVTQFQKLATVKPATEALASLLGGWADDAIKGRMAKNHASLRKEIRKKLGNSRMIVFVDDLDRVRPAVLPSMLLQLREVLDHPNCFYVLGLAPEIVEASLSTSNGAWSSKGVFLDKIVELPVHLPTPTAVEMKLFLRAILERVGNLSFSDDVQGLANLLPPNPRKVKIYLRYLYSLGSLIDRFDDDELNVRAFLLTQMLRVLFPFESQRLFADAKALKAIESSYWQRVVSDINGKKDTDTSEAAEAEYAPEDVDSRQRFLAICQSLRLSASSLSQQINLSRLFHLPEEPPHFTLRDVREWLQQTEGKIAEDAHRELESRLQGDQLDSIAKTHSLWQQLVRVRESFLELGAGLEYEDEVKASLKRADAICDLLSFLANHYRLFSDEMVDVADLYVFFEQAARWSHFRKLPHFVETRKKERDLLSRIVSSVSTSTAATIYHRLALASEFSDQIPEEFRRYLDSIREQICLLTAKWVLSQFSIAGGLQQFWSIPYTKLGKQLLFDGSSMVYTRPDLRSEFLDHSKRANAQRSISQNFLTYFRMVTYGASEGGSFPSEGCRKLLKDHEIMGATWGAALAFPLNQRVVGDLRQHKEALLAEGVPPQKLAEPFWWKHLEQEFFSKDGKAEEDHPREDDQQGSLE